MKIFKLATVCGCALMAYSQASWAENNEKLANTLSLLYGAPVDVRITGSNCTIKYPETKIEEEVQQYIAPTTPDEQPRYEMKTETTVIPETTPECRKTEDFYGMAQYKITSTTPETLIAQLYNFTNLSFFKNFEIKTFKEEKTIVPELGLISSDQFRMADAVYTQKDPTTGLKSELGNLKELTYNQKVTRDKDIVKYRLDSKLDTLNLALPFFSMQMKSIQSAAEMDYKFSVDDEFDFGNIVQNFKYLTRSKSRSVGKGIKMEVSFFDVGVAGDFENKNSIDLKPTARAFDGSGSFLLNHVAITGSQIDKAKQFQSFALVYKVNNMPIDSVVSLSEIQKKRQEKLVEIMQSDKEPVNLNSDEYDRELAKIMDDVFEKGSVIIDTKVKFSAGSIAIYADVKKKDGYLFGEVKVSVNNLYGIFPERKQCMNNPLADTVPECQKPSALDSLKEYIDVTKDNSVTVFQFNGMGIYKGNQKIGEPIELNFQKMLAEKQAMEKARAEQMQQMSAAQSAEE
ncbi:MAG: hypothetical protein J6N49_01725 [Alphaproteobacteria bacterium]|nr:hypothetical protein [Alphaproteobacteria bacterium]